MFDPIKVRDDIIKINGQEPEDVMYWRLGQLKRESGGPGQPPQQIGFGAYDSHRFIPWHAVTSVEFEVADD